jgi:hypothetical protein
LLLLLHRFSLLLRTHVFCYDVAAVGNNSQQTSKPRARIGIPKRDWDKEGELFESAGSRFTDGRRAEEFRLAADRISSLILHSDVQRVDIEIAIESFRNDVLAEFPDGGELFDAIYLARFKRLWSQFREEPDLFE